VRTEAFRNTVAFRNAVLYHLFQTRDLDLKQMELAMPALPYRYYTSFVWLFHRFRRRVILWPKYSGNAVHGETRHDLPERCPVCDHRDCHGIGPRRWYGICKIFGLFDTEILAEVIKCDWCGNSWGERIYYPEDRPWLEQNKE
jgi:hypothetical protein